MNIKEQALNRIINQLSNLGYTHRVQLGDDVVADTIPAPKRRNKVARRDFEGSGLYDGIKQMQPGESTVVDAPEGMDKRDLQGVLSARMIGLYGRGSYITSQCGDRDAVEVLRLE